MNATPDEEGISSCFKGRSPPELSDEWKIPTIARRITRKPHAVPCAGTGEDVCLDEYHLYVTLKRPKPGYGNSVSAMSNIAFSLTEQLLGISLVVYAVGVYWLLRSNGRMNTGPQYGPGDIWERENL